MRLNRDLCNIINNYLKINHFYIEHNMPPGKFSEDNSEYDYTKEIYDDPKNIILDVHHHINDLFDQDRLYTKDNINIVCIFYLSKING